ncbi:MAG TPA: PIN domain-containing protein [Myxococcaceae bacterium]|nr:PIN domain-containing protein [Myxococcaceae bacterium]
MGERWLLDTGFVVALVNENDDDHERCQLAWQTVRGEIHTVEGVLVETAYLFARIRDPYGMRSALGIMTAVGAEFAAPSAARYGRAVALMEQYRSLPMDFVDASLVALGEEKGVDRVLTLDRRGFGAYRLHGKGKFRITPD